MLLLQWRQESRSALKRWNWPFADRATPCLRIIAVMVLGTRLERTCPISSLRWYVITAESSLLRRQENSREDSKTIRVSATGPGIDLMSDDSQVGRLQNICRIFSFKSESSLSRFGNRPPIPRPSLCAAALCYVVSDNQQRSDTNHAWLVGSKFN